MSRFIWEHSLHRKQFATFGGFVLVVVGACCVALRHLIAAEVIFYWTAFFLFCHTRPWFYRHLNSGIFRSIAIVWLASTLILFRINFPMSWHIIGILGGVLVGVLLLIPALRDVRLLLDPVIMSLQPPLPLSGVFLRSVFIVLAVCAEEAFYRVILINVFIWLSVGSVALSSVVFLAGDIAGSWGPPTSIKRLMANFALGLVNGFVYFYTHNVLFLMASHLTYLAPQFVLMTKNYRLHQHMLHNPAQASIDEGR